jgi:hypothetical protein
MLMAVPTLLNGALVRVGRNGPLLTDSHTGIQIRTHAQAKVM